MVATGTESARTRPRARPRGRRSSLLWSIFAANATVLLAAGTVLAISPATVSNPVSMSEAATILVGVGAMLVITVFLMRRALSPLERLSALMQQVDPLRRGQRISTEGGGAEVAELAAAFNLMLERLERERRDSTRRTLSAQEAERRRLAHELHDEVGQSLTALTLQLAAIAERAPEALAEELVQARELARSSGEDVRRVVAELRPEALDDLGLAAALASLSERLTDRTGVEIERRFGPLPALSPEAELVAYRVAQESLTNVIRHSGADRAELRLEPNGRRVRVRVIDRGRGMVDSSWGSGHGIRGMRERALLIGAGLEIHSEPGDGVEVVLEVPVEEES